MKVNTVRGELEVKEDNAVGNDQMVWSNGRVDPWPGIDSLLETLDKEFSLFSRGYDLSDRFLSLSTRNFTDLLAVLLSQ